MKVKTIMKYHFTPVRMAIIKKTKDNKCWPRCGEKGTLCTVGGNVNWCSKYGNSIEGAQKIKNRTTIRSNSTSAYVYKGNKVSILEHYLHPHVHCRYCVLFKFA